jgi:hypothetical protein
MNSPEELAEATRENHRRQDLADNIAEGVLNVIREQADKHDFHPDDLLTSVIERLDESAFTPEGKAANEAFRLLPDLIKKINEDKSNDERTRS